MSADNSMCSAFHHGGARVHVGSARRIVGVAKSRHQFLPLLVAVILLVLIRSPIYFWRNLLWLSSLSCSERTASTRFDMANKSR